MSGFADRLTSRFTNDMSVLASIPAQLLSAESIADGAGFAALSMLTNTVRPTIASAVSSMPAGTWLLSIWDGMMVKANLLYGAQTQSLLSPLFPGRPTG